MWLRLQLIVIIFIFPLAVFSQVSDDEYRQQLADAKSNKERTDVLLSMPESFIEKNATEALGLSTELLERVRGNDSNLAKSNLLVAVAYYNLDRNEEATRHLDVAHEYYIKNNSDDLRLGADIEYYTGTILGEKKEYVLAKERMSLALQYANQLNDDELRTYTLSELARFEDRLGNAEASIKYHLEAYEIDKRRNDSTSISQDLNNLARSYSKQGKLEIALGYYREAFEYIADNSMEQLALNFNNIGNIFLNLNQQDSSEMYLNRGLSIANEYGFNEMKIVLLLNSGILEAKRGSYNVASEKYDQAESLIDETGIISDLANVYQARLNLQSNQKKYDEALRTTNDLLTNPRFNLTVNERINTLFRKSEILSNLGRHEQANNTLWDYLDIKESYQNSESALQYERFRTIYETDKKEDQLKIVNLELANQRSALKVNRAARNVLIALLLLSLGFALFLRNIFIQRRKIRQLEYETNLANMNGELLDMRGRIATLIEEQPETVVNNELPGMEEMNQFLMDPVTEREYEVLKSMESGMSNKEIAEAQFVSVNTIKFHLKNIYLKLDVGNRVQALQRVRSIK